MAERSIVLDNAGVLDQPPQAELADAVRRANQRAEHAEAELDRLNQAAAHQPAARSNSTGTTDRLKTPPSPSTEINSADVEDQEGPDDADIEQGTDTDVASREPGVQELRADSMMAHLLDALTAGKDIGHYGRLVFAMVARHFLAHEDVIGWLTRDPDFSREQAIVMLRQVDGRDYNPPRRERILEWQMQQDFPILPHPEDPDCGNLYRNLKFPEEVYQHISNYQEAKVEAGR